MDRRPVGSARIIRGNALALPLADESVDLVVTSPPYFGLRSYQDGGEHYDGQIGAEATPAEFVDALLAATREMVRVLKPAGSIWVNLGDKYATRYSSERGGGRAGLNDDDATRGRSGQNRTGCPDKSLIGVPWRYALRCIDDLGLILRAEVIWSKPNGLPESVTDRVRRSHETWFHFVRSPRYYSAVDEIREDHLHPLKGGGEANGRHERGAPGFARHSEQTPHPLGKLPGSVWTVPTQPLRVPASLGIDHFAAFPMEWPRRIIRGWSPAGVCVECGEGRRPVTTQTGETSAQRNARLGALSTAVVPGRESRSRPGQSLAHKGGHNHVQSYVVTGHACACPEPTAATTPGVVLDPFGGTGTTALVAKVLGRHGVHVDMSADYCRLAQWRTTDPGEIARAMQVEKPAVQTEGQVSMFDLLDEESA